MKNDISNRADITLLVNTFYERAKRNDRLAHFFGGAIDIDWEKHLPLMYDFWESVVFNTGSYSGNPVNVHKHVHGQHNIKAEDFQEWLRLFNSTVDDMFEGDNAALVKQRAASVATVLQLKILHGGSFPG